MYPNLYYFFKDIFGIELPFLSIIQTFGLLMALSFLAAYAVFTAELKRKEKEGKVFPFQVSQNFNKPISSFDIFVQALIYFLIGYKFIGIILEANPQNGFDAPGYLLSTQGNLIAGLVFGIIGAYLKYREQQAVKGLKPETKKVTVHPYQWMGNITMVAAISGLLGAKIFHILENMGDFYDDPIGSLISFSGLTYFGGLICGSAGVLWYVRKYGINWRHMIDVGGPAMMLAYGIGRMGCHLSGDGDWGIVNTSPKPSYLSFMPDWFWAYNYPNNVIRECNPYVGEEALKHACNWEDHHQLIASVYPTALWESIACIGLFLLMWAFRKKIQLPGAMFCIYLILAGIERYTIEKIRVNNIIDFLGFKMTQAEYISMLLVLVGIVGLVYFSFNKKVATPENKI